MSTEITSSPLDTGVQPCPGLKITTNAGVTFTDSTGRVHDLAEQRTLTFDEAAGDARLRDIGFGSVDAVRELVRAVRLYPIFRKNARVVRLYDCGLTDFKARTLAPRHLAHQRAQRVA